ncbi:MAG: sulfotransferase family 2 domain-containing protein [Roseovarius sp.]
MALELIFVHVPKTGGSSIRAAAQYKFGTDLLLDYADRITNPEAMFNCDRAAYLRRNHLASLQGRRAVYGHFWIGKYRGVQADCRATILRDPVERLISHFYYWISDDNTPEILMRNALRRKLVTENLSIVEFAALPNIRDFYSNCFFTGIDMSQFDLIADISMLRDDPNKIDHATGLTVGRKQLNRTDQKLPAYLDLKERFYADSSALSRVRTLLQDDIRFYEKWVEC